MNDKNEHVERINLGIHVAMALAVIALILAIIGGGIWFIILPHLKFWGMILLIISSVVLFFYTLGTIAAKIGDDSE